MLSAIIVDTDSNESDECESDEREAGSNGGGQA